ncbi:uncharacterized protein TRIADDRAFT_53796 [Trichoplax adhaerens]|uniref:G-protein coupled receptors family 1 profile domain-containing protein n=1 Tax=Trichoplax adhaerens TaxID=10228 RepID=B3RQ69_TRIAD|nr:hypothetical protein TRIADDRAFT_53796 [Trichoplax adhaerens]EDV27771.1 hypothetical protein TRIADDRAFT_53796 [Trichoplax adhaerens]|eukprot:XP_002109605.1 hypothetical protein TRIADDRAFT_53796 [Trichoplax adhaerens]
MTSIKVFDILISVDSMFAFRIMVYTSLNKLLNGTFSNLPKLKDLNLHMNNIEKVEEGVFAGSNNIKTIYLNSNSIRVIPKLLFENLSILREIKLSSNQITKLSSYGLSTLVSVVSLNLDHNLIHLIEACAFNRLKKLRILNLANNLLSNISSASMKGLSHLKTLWLDENRFSSLKFADEIKLLNLTHLYLRNNQILLSKHILLKGLPQLETLDLSHNMLEVIPYFETKDYVQVLNLSYNAIYDLSATDSSKSITFEAIYLSRNRLSNLEETCFISLLQLEKLSLDNNFIAKVNKDCIRNLTSLTELDFSWNMIKYIEEEALIGLDKLQILYLRDNQIEHLREDVFSNLISIKEIYLDGNKMDSLIDVTFTRLARLTILFLQHNNISFISKRCFTFLALISEILDIGFNDFANNIPDLMDKLLHTDLRVTRLGISGNGLKTLWNSFNIGLVRKEIGLGLSGLQLKRLPSPNLRHLEGYIAVLTLNNNFIKEFDVEDFFSGSDSNLLELNISDNSITNFCDNAWQKFAPKLRNVSLKANPLLTISEKSLYGPQQLSTVFTSRDYFCCLVPAKVTACEPIIVESLTSCQNLLSHLSLRLYIWIIGGLAFIGNLLVLRLHWIKRHSSRSKGTSQLLIINLAVSDFLMSIYLLIIAISDQIHVNNYGVRAESWLRSPICALAFFLGSLSSIMSVISILLISVDLYFRCTNPFNYQNRNCRSEKFKVTVIILWLICIIFVAIPAVTSTNAAGNDRIYKYSSICMPSNVEDAFYRSWITIATVCMVCIWLTTCILYALVLLKVHQSSQSVHKSAQLDRKLARKLFLILFTDLISWLPYYILIFKVILTGRIDIFTLKFVIILTLPMNSALNPYLYSFTCPTSPGRALLSIRKSFSGRLRDYYSDPLRQVNHYFFKCNDNNDPQNNLEGPDVNITLNNTECLQTVDREEVVKRTLRESNV